MSCFHIGKSLFRYFPCIIINVTVSEHGYNKFQFLKLKGLASFTAPKNQFPYREIFAYSISIISKAFQFLNKLQQISVLKIEIASLPAPRNLILIVNAFCAKQV